MNDAGVMGENRSMVRAGWWGNASRRNNKKKISPEDNERFFCSVGKCVSILKRSLMKCVSVYDIA